MLNTIHRPEQQALFIHKTREYLEIRVSEFTWELIPSLVGMELAVFNQINGHRSVAIVNDIDIYLHQDTMDIVLKTNLGQFKDNILM